MRNENSRYILDTGMEYGRTARNWISSYGRLNYSSRMYCGSTALDHSMLLCVGGCVCRGSWVSVIFSRPYCYTVWSVIGIIMSSVCPFVCNAVHCGSQGRCMVLSGEKLYQRVPSRQIPIYPFTHFCCRMYRLDTKRTEKMSQRKSEREFFQTDNQACTGHVTFCYSLTSWSLASHAWVNWVMEPYIFATV